MRRATRVTLFVHDNNPRADMVPDMDVLHLLLEQVPLITRNDDGSRTFVFDLANPAEALAGMPPAAPSLDRLRHLSHALAQEARALGLDLAAGLAESAELVAEAEAGMRRPPGRA
ncbi:hypothetical protein [Falsiroseomonas sp. CW058]|uniref:hypothetical protein n=1 Tax=Falsiroseomonas sp. CW058 TaxID=3388664 RepID=UPI003D310558